MFTSVTICKLVWAQSTEMHEKRLIFHVFVNVRPLNLIFNYLKKIQNRFQRIGNLNPGRRDEIQKFVGRETH